jgi:hypothetical protein
MAMCLYSNLPSWALEIVVVLGVIGTITVAITWTIRRITSFIGAVEALLHAWIALRDTWWLLRNHAAPEPLQGLSTSDAQTALADGDANNTTPESPHVDPPSST